MVLISAPERFLVTHMSDFTILHKTLILTSDEGIPFARIFRRNCDVKYTVDSPSNIVVHVYTHLSTPSSLWFFANFITNEAVRFAE
jgi:hypothetical protein